MKRTLSVSFTFTLILVLAFNLAGCGSSNSAPTAATASDGTGSEVAVSTVSGSLQSGGSSSAALQLPKQKESFWASIFQPENWDLLPSAFAATWSCSGTGFTTSYSGPGNYTYTPRSCTVTYKNGKSSSATWSTIWSYNYGSSCGSVGGAGFNPDTQTNGCAITRTSPTGGNTRTLTGVNGNSYAVTHDTTGTNTGWDSGSIPTTSAGVVLTCTAASCASRSLVINGSHLTGTVTLAGGTANKFWDHTVSTTSTGLVIIGTGTSRSVSGTVIVQHNLAKFVSTTTFTSVVYGDSTCCFPTSGSISTVFTGGPNDGKTESLAFSASCGEATLTDSTGAQNSYTLTHCI